jgi:transglutaminase-like putative cysteine protease
LPSLVIQILAAIALGLALHPPFGYIALGAAALMACLLRTPQRTGLLAFALALVALACGLLGAPKSDIVVAIANVVIGVGSWTLLLGVSKLAAMAAPLAMVAAALLIGPPAARGIQWAKEKAVVAWNTGDDLAAELRENQPHQSSSGPQKRKTDDDEFTVVAMLSVSEDDRWGLGYPIYLRQEARQIWTGSSWSDERPNLRTVEDEDDGNADRWITRRSAALPIRFRLHLLERPQPSLPGLADFVALRSPQAMLDGTDSWSLPGPPDVGVTYSAISDYRRFDPLAHRNLALAKGNAADLAITSELSRDLRKRTATLGNRQGMDLVLALRASLARYRYRALPALLTDIRLQDFLDETQDWGSCVHFATAYTLLLRAHGIPARLVVGLTGGAWHESTEHFIFYRRDYHAWTEIATEKGWMPIDATPPSSFPREAPPALELDIGELDPVVENAELPAVSAPMSGLLAILRRHLSVWVTAAVLILLLLRLCRRPVSRDVSSQPAVYTPSFFRLFATVFAGCGVRKSASQTIREYVSELKSRGLVEDELDEMADYCYACRYAGAAPDSAREASYLGQLQALAGSE